MKKLLTPVLASILVAMSSQAVASEEAMNKIELQVLKNKQSQECQYMDQVVIEAKFRILEEEVTQGELLLEGSTDGVSFFTIEAKPFIGKRGLSMFRFDAGDCLQDVKVSFSELN